MRCWRHVPTSHTHTPPHEHSSTFAQSSRDVRDMTNSMLTLLLCVGCVVADLCVGSGERSPPGYWNILCGVWGWMFVQVNRWLQSILYPWLSEPRGALYGALLHTGHITYRSKLIPTSILLSHFIFTHSSYAAVCQWHDLCVAVFEWSVKDCRAGWDLMGCDWEWWGCWW